METSVVGAHHAAQRNLLRSIKLDADPMDLLEKRVVVEEIQSFKSLLESLAKG